MSESFFSEKLIPIILKILFDFKQNNKVTFLTYEVIEKQIGRYVNDNCPATYSFNANYGKFLKEHSQKLEIVEIREKVPFKDKYGKKSTCSEWKLQD